MIFSLQAYMANDFTYVHVPHGTQAEPPVNIEDCQLCNSHRSCLDAMRPARCWYTIRQL